MASEQSSDRSETKRLLKISNILSHLPIPIGGCISMIWKKEIDVSFMAPFIATGYLLLGLITWMLGKKEKRISAEP